MNQENIELATEAEVRKAFEYMKRPEVKEMFAKADEAEKRDRKLYLEHPDRKQFFSYDFVEAFWFHMRDYYGVVIGDAETEELIIELMEDNRLWEMVYDICQELASKRGWEMK
ncbi:MAG: hypothetical protein AAB776_03055 [Patescibacteria group bacterium]|mgnify:CR=1